MKQKPFEKIQKYFVVTHFILKIRKENHHKENGKDAKGYSRSSSCSR